MKIDKRVIECGIMAGCIGLAVIAAPLSQANPISPNVVSSKIIEEPVAFGPGALSSHAGLALTLDSENSYFFVKTVEVLDMKVENPEVVEAAPTYSEYWETRVMANVETYVNVRADADEGSEIVGRFYQRGLGVILERTNGWTKISSGSVEGFVKDEFLAFGAEAEEVANRDCQSVATVITDTVNVRKDAAADADIAGLAGEGDQFFVVDRTPVNGFIQIEFEGNTAYISADLVEVDLNFTYAKTIEEANAADAAANKSNSNANASNGNSELSMSQQGAVSASYSETELLAALIYCEAGSQGYEGQLAVGAVVMNRVRSGVYPNTITDVIYQSGQFGPAWQGTLQRCVEGGYYSDSCLQAAQDAIAGMSNVGDAIGFRFATGNGIEINGVEFF